jgi:hypothetical protein
MMAYLYIILSRTTTGAGKLIRRFTRSYYNHVSMTLNEDLSDIVSFARFNIDTPMHAGYVAEPVERFLYAGGPVPIRVFRVEIPDEKSQRLKAFFLRAGDRELGLLYNYFGALMTMFRIRCRIPGAYTCLSFATTVLGKPYRTFQELEQDLTPFEIFHGDFEERYQDSGDRSDHYFIPRGFFRGTWDSVVHMSRLVARSTRLRKFDDPVSKL